MKLWIACIALLASTALVAQQTPNPQPRGPQGPPKSPPASVSEKISGKTITIDYSSPRVNGREGHIFTPEGLISHDPGYPVWRAGANAATKLTTEAELDFGSFKLPEGEYSLFLNIAEPEGWVLVVNKQVGEWGLRRDPAQDLGTAKMLMEKPIGMVENLSWFLQDLGGGKGKLTLEWESKKASVIFTVR